MSFFCSRFTFKSSFFFRFATWKWPVSSGNHATITISDWFEMFWFLIALLLYPKSTILELFFLDPKDLCLPSHFSRRSWQKRSASTYLTWSQRRNWVASMILIINTYFQSFICLPQYQHGHFLASIFCKFSLAILNRVQPTLEKLIENITKPWKPSTIDRSNK